MMKIAQVIPTLDRSGAEKQLLLLSRELKRRGHDVHIGVLTRFGPLEPEFRAAGLPIELIGKPLKIDPFALRRLSRWMKSNRFDVVQSWLFAANAYARVAARQSFVKKSAERPAVIATEMAVDLWKSPLHFRIDRMLASACDVVVGNSQAVVNFYRDQVGVDSEKLCMIHSGIEAEEAEPICSEAQAAARLDLGIAPNEGPVILFAGRLAEQKRVEDLLKAVDILQYIYPQMRVLIAGEGPLRTSLEKFAAGVAVADKTQFLGLRQDMDRLYAAADVVVLPSSYEGLPNLVLEAQLRALPVVAAAAPGTVELIEHDTTGLLYPIGDSTELARQLERLLPDPEFRLKLGRQARECITTGFSVRLMVDRFERLYEETCGKIRRRS